jgi:hypothetical protein
MTPTGVRRGALRKVNQAVVDSEPPTDERLMAELRRRFKGEVVATSEYLDRDLVDLWRYDEMR